MDSRSFILIRLGCFDSCVIGRKNNLHGMSFQDLESGRGSGPIRKGFVNGRQDPTQAVASGIFQINTAVSTFQRLVNTLGTAKDTPELREKLSVLFLFFKNLIQCKKNDLLNSKLGVNFVGIY